MIGERLSIPCGPYDGRVNRPHYQGGSTMAQYAIFLFDTETAGDPTPEEMQAHQRHADELVESGAMVVAFALDSTATATTLRGDVVSDGPFIDAKEVVAGFYVVEAPDLDAALELAGRNPIVQSGHGGVEVRPVVGSIAPSTR